jgi:hypothetical protein
MKRLLSGLLVGLTLAMPQARAELRGKVSTVVNPEAPRGDWRRVPLPGAYVVVYWSVVIPAPAHATSSCRYSEFARSDEKGEYTMEGPNFVTAGFANASFNVYSPGLELINFPYGGTLHSEKDITMVKSTRPPQERLSLISAYADPSCSSAKPKDPRGLLEDYHRALLEEARTLPTESSRGRNQLQHLEAAARRASAKP